MVPTIWAFCKKHHPSGEVHRLKACMCMRRDLQCENHANNETFAPIVEWATVRMFFSLSIVEGWSATSVDFKNTFAKATTPKPVHLDLPPGHVQANPGAKGKVMKIKNSFCGDCCAENLWCVSLLSKTWDLYVQKWIHVHLSRTIALLHYAWMMQLSSPKMMQKLSLCCSNSKTSSVTSCVTKCFHHTWEFNSTIHPMDASNCHSHTSSLPQLTSWVLVMPTHGQLQLCFHSSNIWIFHHLTHQGHQNGTSDG